MVLTQNWVGYLDRSYEQIKKSVLAKLGITVTEITDHTESNILIIIISIFSGIAEMLNLYIDNMAREAFIGTARKYSSVIKLSRLMDYQVKAKNPASVDLLFYLVDSLGNPLTNTASVIYIPAGTIVTNANISSFRVIKNLVIDIGKNQVVGAATQDIDVLNNVIGSITGAPNQQINLPDSYVQDSLSITINGVKYQSFNSFGLMAADTLGFVVNIGEDGGAYVEFGDNTNGKIPPIGASIIASYRLSDGALGNTPPNTLTTILGKIILPDNYTLKVTNPDYASGGTDFETIEEIRNRAPRDIRTLNRAVTYQDYLDAPLLVPGIGNARVRYCCGKFIDMFIIPSTKGIATLAQIEKVSQFMDKRKILGTFVNVQAAGLTKIWIKGTIYGKPLISTTEIQLQVADALDKEYGYSKIEINRKISASEIIALLEGLSKVDRFELAEIRILPYARKVETTINPLNITFLTLPKSTLPYKYQLQWNGSTFEVYRQDSLLGLASINTNFADGNLISFNITNGTYSVGDKWEFTVFPSYPEIFPVTLININDFSAPIVDVADYVDDNTQRAIYSNLSIVTQDIETLSLPDCDN